MPKKPCSIHTPGNFVWTVSATENGERCQIQRRTCLRCGTQFTQTVYPDALSKFFPRRRKS